MEIARAFVVEVAESFFLEVTRTFPVASESCGDWRWRRHRSWLGGVVVVCVEIHTGFPARDAGCGVHEREGGEKVVGVVFAVVVAVGVPACC